MRNRNPLRFDPTRTTTLRARLVAEMSRRFRQLRKDLHEFLVVLDALDLGEEPALVFHASPREFRFNTDPQKLEAFNDWFAKQVALRVFAVPAGTPADRPWLAEYVESAYRRGLVNAFIASRAADTTGESEASRTSRDVFLREAFGTTESVDKVRLLYLRAFEDLRGITAEMGSAMSRILSQGLIDGKGPLQLMREMSRSIQSLTRSRAFMLARTEIIRSHAEGQLNAFRRLGISELGLRAEWATAGDGLVCPRCEQMEGRVFAVAAASGMIPLHPNCRCSWIPHVAGTG